MNFIQQNFTESQSFFVYSFLEPLVKKYLLPEILVGICRAIKHCCKLDTFKIIIIVDQVCTESLETLRPIGFQFSSIHIGYSYLHIHIGCHSISKSPQDFNASASTQDARACTSTQDVCDLSENHWCSSILIGCLYPHRISMLHHPQGITLPMHPHRIQMLQHPHRMSNSQNVEIHIGFRLRLLIHKG